MFDNSVHTRSQKNIIQNLLLVRAIQKNSEQHLIKIVTASELVHDFLDSAEYLVNDPKN